MKIIISNHIDITRAPEPMLRNIRDTFTLRKPTYDAAVKMGCWLGKLDEYLCCYSEETGTVTRMKLSVYGECGQNMTNPRDTYVTE